MLTPLETEEFDALRSKQDDVLGDPLGYPLDHARTYIGVVYQLGLTGPGTPEQQAPIPDWWKQGIAAGKSVLNRTPVPVADLETTRELFHQYGTEIGSALLLAALPEAYAAAWGARVLAATGQLQDQASLRRRIRATAQFITAVLAPEGDVRTAWTPPDGDAFRAVVGLRMFHQMVRAILMPNGHALAYLGPKNAHPLNQEDLLATQMTFVVSVFEVLEKFGIAWTEQQQQSFLASWLLIGELLGIEPLPQPIASLTPADPAHARALLAKLRYRQWFPVRSFQPVGIDASPAGADGRTLIQEWDSLQPGRLLVRALLDELSSAMKTGKTEGWPLALMRQLAPPVVGARLGLGSNGLMLTALGGLPRRQVPAARFTRFTMPNPIQARVLRAMANTVTRQTVVSWLRSNEQPPFVLPGLEAWASGIRAEAAAPSPLV